MKRLHKSQTDRILAGVCGGIGEYFKINTLAIRIIWLVSILWNGSGIIAYLLALIIMPRHGMGSASREEDSKSRLLAGLFLVLIGVFLVVRESLHLGYLLRLPNLTIITPLSLVALGLILILVFRESRSTDRSRRGRSFRFHNRTGAESGIDRQEEEYTGTVKPRQMRRSRRERIFLGICGGAGEYFSTDPILIRLGMVLLLLAIGSFSFVLYLLLYFLIPLEPHPRSSAVQT